MCTARHSTSCDRAPLTMTTTTWRRLKPLTQRFCSKQQSSWATSRDAGHQPGAHTQAGTLRRGDAYLGEKTSEDVTGLRKQAGQPRSHEASPCCGAPEAFHEYVVTRYVGTRCETTNSFYRVIDRQACQKVSIRVKRVRRRDERQKHVMMRVTLRTNAVCDEQCRTQS